MPDQFDQAVVLNQLRYSGMLETVRIRKAGYAVRRPFQDFYKRQEGAKWSLPFLSPAPSLREQKVTPRALSRRYKVLMRSLALPEDIRGKCTVLLQLYDASNSEWQLGKTKVEWRESATPAGDLVISTGVAFPDAVRCLLLTSGCGVGGCACTHTHIPGSQEC